MAAVIIKQNDVKRLGKELINEMFEFLHDEHILTKFSHMKEVQKEFLKNLAFNHINTLHRQYKIFKIDKNSSDLEKKVRVEYDTNLVKDAMEDNGIDTEGIYHTLLTLNLSKEIYKDLYFKTKAFLDIFRVFEISYMYLED